MTNTVLLLLLVVVLLMLVVLLSAVVIVALCELRARRRCATIDTSQVPTSPAHIPSLTASMRRIVSFVLLTPMRGVRHTMR